MMQYELMWRVSALDNPCPILTPNHNTSANSANQLLFHITVEHCIAIPYCTIERVHITHIISCITHILAPQPPFKHTRGIYEVQFRGVRHWSHVPDRHHTAHSS